MYFEIPGTVRIKKNSRRIFAKKGGKGVINLPSKAYVEWEKMARDQISTQLPNHLLGYTPLSNPIHVRVVAYYKGRKPDLSGVLESVGDAFEGIVWDDDTQIESWDGSRLIHDLKNPRLCLWVEDFNSKGAYGDENYPWSEI